MQFVCRPRQSSYPGWKGESVEVRHTICGGGGGGGSIRISFYQMFGMANISGRFGFNVADELIHEASRQRGGLFGDDDDDCHTLAQSCNSSHAPWSRDLPGLLSDLDDADYVLLNQGAHGAPHLNDEAEAAASSSAESLSDDVGYMLRVFRAAAAVVTRRGGKVWAKTSHLPLTNSGLRIKR